MDNYFNLTAKEINSILEKCCDEGDLETLKNLFASDSAKSVLAH